MSTTEYFSEDFQFRSRDGFLLDASLMCPSTRAKTCAVLVHGITVDKDEDGFYVEIARRLCSIGVASLRFDLRGHGRSEGTYEDVTLLSVVNDIASACEVALTKTVADTLHLIAASFGGGLAAMHTANASEVTSLILLNPLLDYKRRMLDPKPFWNGKQLTEEGADQLKTVGWLPHGQFRMGRCLINELLQLKPYQAMKAIDCPVLVIHGTKDGVVPFELAKKYSTHLRRGTFVAIEGADHGFTKPGDEDMKTPQTVQFREQVFNLIIDWVRVTTR